MYYSEYDKRVLPVILVAMILVSVALGLALRRKSLKIRAIPTAFIAAFMVFIEIIKLRWNILGEMNYFYFPVHYCSLFAIVFPLAELFGERMSRIFRPVAASMAFVVSVGMYICPQGMLGNATEVFGQYFYRTHSLIFHHLLVLYVLLVWALQLCKPRVRDTLLVGAFGVFYVSYAIPIANKLETNFGNFLWSEIPFVEELRLNIGQTKYTVLVVAAYTVGIMIGALLYIGVSKIGTIRLGKKNKK